MKSLSSLTCWWPWTQTGIVTRRPLVLQLHRLDEGREYAEFGHLPRRRFTDFGKLFFHWNQRFHMAMKCDLCSYFSWLFQYAIFKLTLISLAFVAPFLNKCFPWRERFTFPSNSWCFIFVIFCTAAVRKEIADETDRETGRSKQISTVPIYLSIYSPNGKSSLDLIICLFYCCYAWVLK